MGRLVAFLAVTTAEAAFPAAATADAAFPAGATADAVALGWAGSVAPGALTWHMKGVVIGGSCCGEAGSAAVFMDSKTPSWPYRLIARSALAVRPLWKRCEIMIMWASSDAPPSERLHAFPHQQRAYR